MIAHPGHEGWQKYPGLEYSQGNSHVTKEKPLEVKPRVTEHEAGRGRGEAWRGDTDLFKQCKDSKPIPTAMKAYVSK